MCEWLPYIFFFLYSGTSTPIFHSTFPKHRGTSASEGERILAKLTHNLFGSLECAMVVGMGEAYVCLCQRPDRTTRSDCVS